MSLLFPTTLDYNNPKKTKTAELILRFAWTRSCRTVVTPGEPTGAKNKSKKYRLAFAETE